MAAPQTTLVPMNRMLSSSSGLIARTSRWLANFSTGIDSPVIAAWPTNRSLAVSTRQSAGIMSPADSTITSPGTSSLIGSSTRRAALPFSGAAADCAASSATPRRSTVAVLLTIAFEASAAWLDFISCQKRSRVESTTIVPITSVAVRSSVR